MKLSSCIAFLICLQVSAIFAATKMELTGPEARLQACLNALVRDEFNPTGSAKILELDGPLIRSYRGLENVSYAAEVGETYSNGQHTLFLRPLSKKFFSAPLTDPIYITGHDLTTIQLTDSGLAMFRRENRTIGEMRVTVTSRVEPLSNRLNGVDLERGNVIRIQDRLFIVVQFIPSRNRFSPFAMHLTLLEFPNPASVGMSSSQAFNLSVTRVGQLQLNGAPIGGSVEHVGNVAIKTIDIAGEKSSPSGQILYWIHSNGKRSQAPPELVRTETALMLSDFTRHKE